MRRANCGTHHQILRSRVIFSIRENTQSERSYKTRKAEHMQIEKKQPSGELGAGKRQCTHPIIEI